MTDPDMQLSASAYLRKLAAGDHAAALALVPADPAAFPIWAATLAGYTLAALIPVADLCNTTVEDFITGWLDRQLDQLSSAGKDTDARP